MLALAVALVLAALKDSIVFFNSPTDVVEKQIAAGCAHAPRRAGQGGQRRAQRQSRTSASTSPTASTRIAVAYQGLLPDLFREGQGVVAEGALEPSGTFKADSVLAKHDETTCRRRSPTP